MRIRYISFLMLSVFAMCFYSCEDVIDVPLEDGGVALVVDGWINNLDEEQTIRLTLSQPYFDNSLPPVVVEASVSIVRDDGETFDFIHRADGEYVWTPANSVLGDIGDSFTLNVIYDGGAYRSVAILNRVPVIDSIGIEERIDETFLDDGLYAQFYARDFAGAGDTYWIKTFRNGRYLEKSQELNIAFDAGFDEGTGIDGLIFIPPIRDLINPIDENQVSLPYDEGDEIRVEIHSISNEAFNFLEIARDQINNGDNGIFTIPLANTRSNVRSDNGEQVLGFFNIAGVSESTRIVE